MFTGIIEEIGEVLAIKKAAASMTLTIKAQSVLAEVRPGDSIAVNGVCLTVVEFGKTSFQADVMHETMNRSSLGVLKIGSKVNLERAMRADGRFGGHMVAGHIDGTGKITDICKDDNAVWYTIAAKPEILRYMVEKGSVAIDGISLTVAKLTQEDFSVSVIPHTLCRTILSERAKGDIVNLENDLVGKYIEKYLEKYFLNDRQKNMYRNENRIDENFLMRNGFL